MAACKCAKMPLSIFKRMGQTPRNVLTDKICEFSGLALLNKPAGFSSAQFLTIAKRTFGVKKAGHCGTLDPLAEGLLICCLNQATRLSTFLLPGGKTYAVMLKLGSATDTQDTEGTVVNEAPVPAFTYDELVAVLASFTGEIQQVPPAYSALKHEGVPLYKLARKGKAVVKPARTVTIESITINTVDLPYVGFTVTCSAGTYVRTLCHDIGLKLGCFGHMTGLKRTATCGLSLEDALTLDEIRQLDRNQPIPLKGFIPMREALPEVTKLTAEPGLVEKLSYGRLLYARDFAALQNADLQPNTIFCVLDEAGELQAIVEFTAMDAPLRQCAVFCAQN